METVISTSLEENVQPFKDKMQSFLTAGKFLKCKKQLRLTVLKTFREVTVVTRTVTFKNKAFIVQMKFGRIFKLSVVLGSGYPKGINIFV